MALFRSSLWFTDASTPAAPLSFAVLKEAFRDNCFRRPAPKLYCFGFVPAAVEQHCFVGEKKLIGHSTPSAQHQTVGMHTRLINEVEPLSS